MKRRILVIVCITVILALIHRHARQHHARHSHTNMMGRKTPEETYHLFFFSLPGIHLLLSQL